MFTLSSPNKVPTLVFSDQLTLQVAEPLNVLFEEGGSDAAQPIFQASLLT